MLYPSYAPLPLAGYLWKTRALVQGAMQDVCFYYDEEHWTERNWTAERDRQINAGNINCPIAPTP